VLASAFDVTCGRIKGVLGNTSGVAQATAGSGVEPQHGSPECDC